MGILSKFVVAVFAAAMAVKLFELWRINRRRRGRRR